VTSDGTHKIPHGVFAERHRSRKALAPEDVLDDRAIAVAGANGALDFRDRFGQPADFRREREDGMRNESEVRVEHSRWVERSRGL
jgi:hypothetical protein